LVVIEFKVVMHVRTNDPLIDERDMRRIILTSMSPRVTFESLDVQVWETDETDQEDPT
jgi:hypothetical protein